MIDAEFRVLAERSIEESFCIICEDRVAVTDASLPIIPIGEDADVLARMCDDCLRDYLAWREQDQRKQGLS